MMITIINVIVIITLLAVITEQYSSKKHFGKELLSVNSQTIFSSNGRNNALRSEKSAKDDLAFVYLSFCICVSVFVYLYL